MIYKGIVYDRILDLQFVVVVGHLLPSVACSSLPLKVLLIIAVVLYLAIFIALLPYHLVALSSSCLCEPPIQVATGDLRFALGGKAFLQQNEKTSIPTPTNFEATLHKDFQPQLARHGGF